MNKRAEHYKERMHEGIHRYYLQIFLALAGIPVGIAVGAAAGLFGLGTDYIAAFRSGHEQYLLPFLAAGGLIIVFVYSRFGGICKKGMNLVFEVGLGLENRIPLRIVPLAIGATWISHLCGASVGREGVAVIIGAAIAHPLSRRLRIPAASRIFLITGMVAGFSGLFGTPLAAIFFGLEVLAAGSLEYRAMLPAITAAFAANATTRWMGLARFHYDLPQSVVLSYPTALKIALLGLIFGTIGLLFAYCIKHTHQVVDRIFPDPYKRIGILGVLLTVLLLICFKGRYAGTGSNLISASFFDGTVFWWDWILKMLFSVLCLSAGFMGGELMPIFSIGASVGVLLGPVFGLPVEFAAALGFTAVFASATRTFLSPVFVGAEIFGYDNVPYFFLVCAVSYFFNAEGPIYLLQRSFTVRDGTEESLI